MNGWYFFPYHFRLLNYVSRFNLTFTNTENYYPLNLRGYSSKEKNFTVGEHKYHFLLGPTTGSSKETDL